MLVIIQVLVALLNIIEAKLETKVVALKNPNLPNYPYLDRQEHIWSAIYYCCIVGILTYLSYNSIGLILIPLLLLNRRLIFQEALNLFRGKGLFYLGDKGIDGFTKKIFGKYAGVVNALVCIVLIIVLNLI